MATAVWAPFKITITPFFAANCRNFPILSKSLSALPAMRSNSLICGVKMDLAGRNPNQVLFSASIFNASASKISGSPTSSNTLFNPWVAALLVPKPQPMATALMLGYRSKSMRLKLLSLTSRLKMASGMAVGSRSQTFEGL